MHSRVKGMVPWSGSPSQKSLPDGACCDGRTLRAVCTAPSCSRRVPQVQPWSLMPPTPSPQLLPPTGDHVHHKRREAVPEGHGGCVRGRVSEESTRGEVGWGQGSVCPDASTLRGRDHEALVPGGGAMLAQGLWVDGFLNGTEKRKQENSCSTLLT